ncbi:MULTISPECIES: hypothetical protein [Rhodococcus]
MSITGPAPYRHFRGKLELLVPSSSSRSISANGSPGRRS